MYLDASAATLGKSTVDKAGKLTYRGLSEGVTFLTQPLEQETEITGQLSKTLCVIKYCRYGYVLNYENIRSEYERNKRSKVLWIRILR
jgi:hypothetical protein